MLNFHFHRGAQRDKLFDVQASVPHKQQLHLSGHGRRPDIGYLSRTHDRAKRHISDNREHVKHQAEDEQTTMSKFG